MIDLIEQCPNTPHQAAAYMRGVEVTINEVACSMDAPQLFVEVLRHEFAKLQRHVLRVKQSAQVQVEP